MISNINTSTSPIATSTDTTSATLNADFYVYRFKKDVDKISSGINTVGSSKLFFLIFYKYYINSINLFRVDSHII